jgi:hypothetical protein
MKKADILQNQFTPRKEVKNRIIEPGCRKVTLIFSALLLLATTLCTGCSKFLQTRDYGYKRPSIFYKTETLKYNYTNKESGDYFRKKYNDYIENYKWPEAKQERDQILNELIYVIDAAHGQFERNFRVDKRALDFLSDITILGVNAAGAITGTTETKSILHAISGGIAGTEAAADKRFLADQTIEAILAQMHASMAADKLKIIQSMQNDSAQGPKKSAGAPKSKYTLEIGLSDIVSYEIKKAPGAKPTPTTRKKVPAKPDKVAGAPKYTLEMGVSDIVDYELKKATGANPALTTSDQVPAKPDGGQVPAKPDGDQDPAKAKIDFTDAPKYTLEMGLSDIVEYYYDGTVARAVPNLTKLAKDQEQVNKNEVKKATGANPTQNPSDQSPEKSEVSTNPQKPKEEQKLK